MAVATTKQIGEQIEATARALLTRLRDADPGLRDVVFERLSKRRGRRAKFGVPPFGLCLYVGRNHDERTRALMEIIAGRHPVEVREFLRSLARASIGDMPITALSFASSYSGFPYVSIRPDENAWCNIHSIRATDEEWWDLFRLLAVMASVIIAPAASQGDALRESKYLHHFGCAAKCLHLVHPFIDWFRTPPKIHTQAPTRTWDITEIVRATYFAAKLPEPSRTYFERGRDFVRREFDLARAKIEQQHPELREVAGKAAKRPRAELDDPLVRQALEEWSRGTDTSPAMTAIWFGAQAAIGGDFATSIQLFRRAKDSLAMVSGASHCDVLRLSDIVAKLLRKTGDLDGASAAYEELRCVRAQALGETHRDTLATTLDLARTRSALGSTGEAARLYATLVSAYEKVGGSDRPEALEALEEQATILGEQGRIDDAIPLLERVLAARERARGKDHPDAQAVRRRLDASLTAKKNAALVDQAVANSLDLAGSGRATQAEKMLRQILDGLTRLGGAHTPLIATVRVALARLFMKQSRCREAREQLEHVVKTRERILGELHPDTKWARTMLEAALVGVDPWDERFLQEPFASSTINRWRSPTITASQETSSAMAGLGCVALVVLILVLVAYLTGQ